MMIINCIIVEDEPLARKGLAEYIADIPFLQLVGSFENAFQAQEFLNKHPVDLMLLDIRMPKLSGIDFVKNLQQPPMVIFTTAYPDYALESYELNVLDYLVKPISFDRFRKATQKAFDFYSLRQSSADAGYLFVRSDYKLEKVSFSELLFVEAMQNYCVLHTGSKKLISHITLTQVLEKLPANRFMRIHKSFIVCLEKVTSVESTHLLIHQQRIPISRALKNEVHQRVLRNNLL